MTDDDRSLSAYLSIGAGAAGIVVICGGVGYAVDAGLGTLPIFVFVGLIVGITAGAAFVWGKFRDSLGIRVEDPDNDRNNTDTAIDQKHIEE